jgi:hypothetical protein
MSQEVLIRMAKLHDLMSIEAQEAQRASDPRMFLKDNEEAIENYLASFAWTLYWGLKPEACAGIFLLWPGVASCWGLFSPTALQHPATLSRFAHQGLKAVSERFELRRVETSAPASHTKAHRWLQHLGFEPEGVAQSYGLDGSNHIRYARIYAHGD